MPPKKPTKTRKGIRPASSASSQPSQPDISLGESPVGRATLSAILQEMSAVMPDKRKPFVTIGYDEPAPQAREQRTEPQEQPTCSDGPDVDPDVSVSETRPGFETMAVIGEELLRDAERISHEQQQERFAKSEVLELLTFVILDRSLTSAASAEERRSFVEKRLWHRLPPGGMDSIRRIDVRPADETALMMRVWCAVPKVSP